jgi:hypothetical protein
MEQTIKLNAVSSKKNWLIELAKAICDPVKLLNLLKISDSYRPKDRDSKPYLPLKNASLSRCRSLLSLIWKRTTSMTGCSVETYQRLTRSKQVPGSPVIH